MKIIRNIFLALALLFVTAVPAHAQKAAPAAEKITMHLIVIGEPDTAAKTFLATINTAIKDMTVLSTPAATDDETAPELHVLVIGSDDKETFISVVVLFHVKGHDETVYLGMMAGAIKPEDAAADAHDLLSKAAAAWDGFIEEMASTPAPAGPQKQSDHKITPDIYSHA